MKNPEMPSSGSDAEGPVAETSSLSGRPDFKRILVIRRDKVGDTIMASAALKLLRSLYPSAYIAAIEPYLENPSRARRDGERALAHVRANFDIGNEVAGLSAVYVALVPSGS